MYENEVGPLVRRAAADDVMEGATLELRKPLQELAGFLDPFPNFMDLSFRSHRGEPHGASNPENGCAAVCPVCELRELVLRMIPGPFESGGAEQTEETNEVDMSPREYVGYAHASVHELARFIRARSSRRISPPR